MHFVWQSQCTLMIQWICKQPTLLKFLFKSWPWVVATPHHRFAKLKVWDKEPWILLEQDKQACLAALKQEIKRAGVFTDKHCSLSRLLLLLLLLSSDRPGNAAWSSDKNTLPVHVGEVNQRIRVAFCDGSYKVFVVCVWLDFWGAFFFKSVTLGESSKCPFRRKQCPGILR